MINILKFIGVFILAVGVALLAGIISVFLANLFGDLESAWSSFNLVWYRVLAGAFQGMGFGAVAQYFYVDGYFENSVTVFYILGGVFFTILHTLSIFTLISLEMGSLPYLALLVLASIGGWFWGAYTYAKDSIY